MRLGSASHQKSGQPERVVTGKGEAHAEATRDEARPAFQQQTGLGREGLLWQALTRENMAAAWKRVKTNKGSAGVDGLTIETGPGIPQNSLGAYSAGAFRRDISATSCASRRNSKAGRWRAGIRDTYRS